MGSCCARCNRIFLKTATGDRVVNVDTVNGEMMYEGAKWSTKTFLETHMDKVEVGVLEYDHLPQYVKTKAVSFMPRTLMRSEAAKCQLLCAKCHLIITKERRMEKYGREAYIPWSRRDKTRAIENRKREIGRCEVCGDFEPDLLEYMHFDHLDPKTKVEGVCQMVSNKLRTVEDIIAEMDGCRLSCKPCHRLHTNAQHANGDFAQNKMTHVPHVLPPKQARKSATGKKGVILKRDRHDNINGVTVATYIGDTHVHKHFRTSDYTDVDATVRVASEWLDAEVIKRRKTDDE